MDEKKRKRIGLLLFFAAFLVLVLFFLERNYHNTSEKEKESQVRLEGNQPENTIGEDENEGYRVQMQRDYAYENIEALWFLGSITRKIFQESIEQWLREEKLECRKIRILKEIEEIKKDQVYGFYVQLDDSSDLVKGTYEIPKKQFSYQLNGRHPRLAEIGGVDVELDQRTQEAKADGYYPEDAADEVAEVVLQQEEDLPKEIQPKELEIELLTFLNQQQELRRQLLVDEVTSKEKTVEISIRFVTPRIDGKNLRVTYDREQKRYRVTLAQ